jgi:hypothetical protein
LAPTTTTVAVVTVSDRSRAPALTKRAVRPRATEVLAVTPVYVSDLTAPVLVGLEPRQFRELVVALGIPHVRRGHRVLVAVDKLRAAMDGAEAATPTPTTVAHATPEMTADEILASLGRRAS